MTLTQVQIMNPARTTDTSQPGVSGTPETSDGLESPELVIRPRRGWIGLDWPEMYHYRELLYFLVWRDVKVRYKQTVLGVAWAVLPPIFNMVVFTIVFGNLAGIKFEGPNYQIFNYAGLLPFMFFSNGVNQACQSLVNQQHLLTKVYFPRLFVPTASIGSGLVDLAVSFAVFGCIMAWYQVAPGWGIVFIPLLVVVTVLATLGLGYALASLTVSYRDFRYVLPFFVNALMYVSPVIWSLNSVPAKYRLLMALNPMTGVIDGFRSAILGTPWNLPVIAVSTIVSIGLFIFGLFYFRKTERRFADIA